MKVKDQSQAQAISAKTELRKVAVDQLTRRDLEILRWCSRVRFATSEHVGERFQIHVTNTRKRLAVLTRLGLINRVEVLHRQPAAHHITRAGLRTLGALALPVPTVSLQSFLHDEIVVREQVALELRDVQVLSEREMRLGERTMGEDYTVTVPPHATSTGLSTHRPDLAFRRDDDAGWIAVEVELTGKSEARLAAILTGYLNSDLYDKVVYTVPSAGMLDRVRHIGTKVGIGDRLLVATLQHQTAA